MSDIREYVLNHDLFATTTITARTRSSMPSVTSMTSGTLGYAVPDLSVAAGTGYARGPVTREEMEKYWPKIRTTGYGRQWSWEHGSVWAGVRAGELMPSPRLQASIRDKSAEEVHEYLSMSGRNRWTIQDGYFRCWDPRQSTRTTMPEGQSRLLPVCLPFRRSAGDGGRRADPHWSAS